MAINNMKDLMDGLKTLLDASKTAGDISFGYIEKGFQDNPIDIPLTLWPYLTLNDGGERVEDTSSYETQMRIYSIQIEIGAYGATRNDAQDNLLEYFNELKTVMESEAYRLLDGMVFARSVVPFTIADDNHKYHGRTLNTEYHVLEERFGEY